MNNKNKIEFIGTVVKNIYMSENFKLYAVDVDKEKYPNIKYTKYGNCSVSGNIQSLSVGEEYIFTCIEQNDSKYGYSYKIENIKKDKPKNEHDIYQFLQEFLTQNQANEIYRFYPNIIDLVLNNETDKIDLTKLHGIGEYTFEKIKQKIIDNYMLFDLVAEYGDALSITVMKKLYDKYPSIEKIRKELQNRPYTCLTNISGIGFKKADSILLDMEKNHTIDFKDDLRTSKQRCMACMMYLIKENEDSGSTKMDIAELRKQLIKLVPKCSHHFVDCIKSNDNFWYSKDTMSVALKSTYNIEYKTAEIIKNALKINDKWDIDWKSYQNKGEFPLTDQQLKLLGEVCNNQICIMSGFAGSGKSATTNTLIKMLQDNNKRFTLVASTGRASKVLAAYTNCSASTIHRAYGYQPPDDWKYDEENKLHTDIVICDEFSMVDSFLFLHLLEGIDFNKTKLLVIGDSAQACSVSAGNCLHDMINSKIIPTVELTQIFRYGEGGLMTVATDTRNGKEFLKNINQNFTFFGKNKDYGFKQCSDDKIISNCVGLYKKLLEKGYSIDDILVLSAQNKGNLGTVIINKELQKIANKNYGVGESITFGETTYYVGDLVMNIANNYRAKIYSTEFSDLKTLIANGEMGIIKKIENGYALIDFDGVLIQYYKDDFKNIVLGYIISIHKSQGGGAKVVILLTPRAHTFLLSGNLSYVALTRTKERCFHLGDSRLVNSLVHKKDELKRNTFLFELLTA